MNRFVAETCLELACALEQIGDRRGALHAASRALALEDTPQAREAVLRLTAQTTPEALDACLEEHPDPVVALKRLLKREEDPTPLTLREERAVARTLQTVLDSLPAPLSKAFAALTIFPQPFLPEQAQSIAQVEGADLEAFREAGLLQTIVRAERVRYTMAMTVRDWARRRVPAAKLQYLSRVHKDYFTRLAVEDFPGVGEIKRQEVWNLKQCADWYLSQPPTKTGMEVILETCRHALHLCFDASHPASHHCLPDIRACCSYFQRLLPELIADERAFIACAMSGLAIHHQDYDEAIRWCRYMLDCSLPQETRDKTELGKMLSDRILMQLLGAAHHRNRDDLFDQAVALAERININYLPLVEQNEFYYILAENRMARGQWQAALEANACVLELRIAHKFKTHLPAAYYQQGCILYRLGEEQEASAAWNRALAGFREQTEAHGVADCLQRLGLLFARQGQGPVGLVMVEQAIALYERLDARPGRAAALGTLGDLYALEGDTVRARALWQEGLVYWETEKHERWIAAFRQRLDTDTPLALPPGG